MKRLEFENKYLEKKVKLVLFDGTEMVGYLHKTGTEICKNNPNLYIPKNHYFVGGHYGSDYYNEIFRKSHITRIKLY